MEALLEFLIYLQTPVIYLTAMLILLACGLGLPIPEDITLFAMGWLSYNGLVDLKLSIFLCLIGVLAGDIILFLLGKKYSKRLLKKAFFKKILPEERLEKVKNLFHKYGNKVMFMARFLPGLRSPAYFTAGVLHLPFRVFIFYDGLAALLSVPLFTSITYIFGDHLNQGLAMAKKIQNGILLLVVGFVLLLLLKHYLPKLFKKTNSDLKEPKVLK